MSHLSAHHANRSSVNEERYVIPNLRNACRILRELGQDNSGHKIADLARALDLPPTTTLRIMTTLTLEGFARKDGNHFFLGPLLIALGSTALGSNDIRSVAVPVLENLSRTTDETAHLALPCGHRSLIAAVCDSPHPLRAASHPGTLAELYCSSTGKVFLSYLFREHLSDILRSDPPQRQTPNTLITEATLGPDLDLTRERGYGMDNEEFFPGVRCLAAPVFGASGDVVAAIGITASTARFTIDRIASVALIVQDAARQVTAGIGGRAPAAALRAVG